MIICSFCVSDEKITINDEEFIITKSIFSYETVKKVIHGK